jgi:hypothetical protein
MGLPALATPLADLTQIEITLLNTEAQAKLKDASMAKQAKLQQGAQQQSMYQQPGGGFGQEGQDPNEEEEEMAAASTGGRHHIPKVQPAQPTPPPKVPIVKRLNPPSVPKLPLAGCRLNAKQIASMDVMSFQAALDSGLITPDIDFLCQQMETQEPGILDQIAEELETYLGMLRKTQGKQKTIHETDFSPKEVKQQQKLYRSKKHKPTDIENKFNVTDRGLPRSRTNQNKEYPR